MEKTKVSLFDISVLYFFPSHSTFEVIIRKSRPRLMPTFPIQGQKCHLTNAEKHQFLFFFFPWRRQGSRGVNRRRRPHTPFLLHLLPPTEYTGRAGERSSAAATILGRPIPLLWSGLLHLLLPSVERSWFSISFCRFFFVLVVVYTMIDGI